MWAIARDVVSGTNSQNAVEKIQVSASAAGHGFQVRAHAGYLEI